MSHLQAEGGLVVKWILAAPARAFVSKTTGERKTVVELRDPARLGSSLVLFLDGDVTEGLAAVKPGALVVIRLDEVRSGRGRGELIGSISRKAVEEAFSHAIAGK